MIKVKYIWLKKNRCAKKHRSLTPALEKSPQKRAVVRRVVIRSPKKPNSAKRKVAKIDIFTKRRRRGNFAYIPGINQQKEIQRYNNVLIRGGRVRDVPGMHYRCIPGVYDFHGLIDRKTSRSKYGKKDLSSIRL